MVTIMDSTSKRKLPLILMVLGILLLVVAVSAIGACNSRDEYRTIADSVPSAIDVANSSVTTSRTSTGTTVAVDNPHRITVTGDAVEAASGFDATLYTKRLYELKYLFAVDGFQWVSDLKPSVVVQFAFCHLYYDSLVDMPDEKELLFRQVLPASITGQIQKLFGKNTIDITKSDLYNADRKLFEMWQPRLRTTVYANTVCTKRSDGGYTLTATFFTTRDKDRIDCVVSGVFQKQGGTFVLTLMQTK